MQFLCNKMYFTNPFNSIISFTAACVSCLESQISPLLMWPHITWPTIHIVGYTYFFSFKVKNCIDIQFRWDSSWNDQDPCCQILDISGIRCELPGWCHLYKSHATNDEDHRDKRNLRKWFLSTTVFAMHQHDVSGCRSGVGHSCFCLHQSQSVHNDQ